MDIKEIIFNILKNNPHLWIRYYIVKELSGFTLPGEYISLRTSVILSDKDFSGLIDLGFRIREISTQIVGADAYANVSLKRDLR